MHPGHTSFRIGCTMLPGPSAGAAHAQTIDWAWSSGEALQPVCTKSQFSEFVVSRTAQFQNYRQEVSERSSHGWCYCNQSQHHCAHIANLDDRAAVATTLCRSPRDDASITANCGESIQRGLSLYVFVAKQGTFSRHHTIQS